MEVVGGKKVNFFVKYNLAWKITWPSLFIHFEKHRLSILLDQMSMTYLGICISAIFQLFLSFWGLSDESLEKHLRVMTGSKSPKFFERNRILDGFTYFKRIFHSSSLKSHNQFPVNLKFQFTPVAIFNQVGIQVNSSPWNIVQGFEFRMTPVRNLRLLTGIRNIPEIWRKTGIGWLS